MPAARRRTGQRPISPSVAQGGSVVVVDPAGHPFGVGFGAFAGIVGAGDVVGPSGGATDHAIARFDGTTGKLLEDSLATLADDGRISSPAGFALLTADPGSPADDTFWVRRTGSSPAMQVELRVRISGVTYSLAGITI